MKQPEQTSCHVLDIARLSSVQWLVKCGCADHGTWSETLCSPNEDFGKKNKRSVVYFPRTFKGFLAQREYSNPKKVLGKYADATNERRPTPAFAR
jgi:hypothetical protein